MPSSSRVVFWDFDGTLARREDLWSGALLDAWRRIDIGAAGTVDQLRPYLRDGFPWHDTATEVAAFYVPTEFYRRDAWVVIDGAEAALELTRAAGYRNILLSNHAPELPTIG
ncbi:MAG: hypothetical protein ACTHNQ_13785 [Microbacterium sp.]|uniref:hypothetical protein n=1 Tax=Microbacterium sp. TaxID=51671 RepID=UPI003F7F3A73